MPGMGELMEGAMQQAAQRGLHSGLAVGIRFPQQKAGRCAGPGRIVRERIDDSKQRATKKWPIMKLDLTMAMA
jgi:hypothetical protein